MEKSNIDKLMELKQLYDQGILTKEEIENEKQKILSNNISKISKEAKEKEKRTTPTKDSSRNDSFFQKNKKLIFCVLGLVIVAIIIIVFSNINKKDPLTIKETLEAVEKDVSDVDSSANYTNHKAIFESKLNAASWLNHTVGFCYPDFFNHTNNFVDEVPGDVDVYYWDDVKICYWSFLGNWSTLEDFPQEGTYISSIDKVKDVVYTARHKGIFSGYTDKGNIYYLKRIIIPDEVPHGKVLVLIHPSSYKGNATDKLTEIVANW